MQDKWHKFLYKPDSLLSPNQQCKSTELNPKHPPQPVATHTHTDTQPFYGTFSRTTRVSRCQKKASSGLYGTTGDMRGRHTDNAGGRHSIRTNQQSTSINPPIFTLDALLLQPCQFILAWDRHQICWIAYPVATHCNIISPLLSFIQLPLLRRCQLDTADKCSAVREINVKVYVQKCLQCWCCQCFDASGLKKLSGEVLAWLTVWNEVQIICIWSS